MGDNIKSEIIEDFREGGSIRSVYLRAEDCLDHSAIWKIVIFIIIVEE